MRLIRTAAAALTLAAPLQAQMIGSPIRVFFHQGSQPLPDPLRDRRPAHAPGASGGGIITAAYRGLLRDPLDGPQGHAILSGDSPGRFPCLQQGMNRMSIKHPEHPPQPPAAQVMDLLAKAPSLQGGPQEATEFREDERQNLENEHLGPVYAVELVEVVS